MRGGRVVAAGLTPLQKEKTQVSSWLPGCPWFNTSASLFDKSEQRYHTFPVLDELREGSGAAVSCEELPARGSVLWAVQQDVLDGLNWLATRASDLLRSVL